MPLTQELQERLQRELLPDPKFLSHLIQEHQPTQKLLMNLQLGILQEGGSEYYQYKKFNKVRQQIVKKFYCRYLTKMSVHVRNKNLAIDEYFRPREHRQLKNKMIKQYFKSKKPYKTRTVITNRLVWKMEDSYLIWRYRSFKGVYRFNKKGRDFYRRTGQEPYKLMDVPQ